MMYQADEKRYETMQYNRCGKSGLLLPKVSLGLWHNFGSNGDYDKILKKYGITTVNQPTIMII